MRCAAAGETGLAEQSRDIGENVQVLLMGLSRNEQCKQQVNRLIVRRIEVDRLLQGNQGAQRLRTGVEAAVRDGDPLAQAGTAQLFPPISCEKNPRRPAMAGPR